MLLTKPGLVIKYINRYEILRLLSVRSACVYEPIKGDVLREGVLLKKTAGATSSVAIAVWLWLGACMGDTRGGTDASLSVSS
jgi:hypothetical protein